MASPASPPVAARPDVPRPPSGEAPAAPDRRLGRRSGPPNGRAVVGGLLVMVAVVATFAAITSARSGPTQQVVVTRSTLDAGHRLDVGDLRTVTAELPDDVLGGSFASVDELVGAVALAPVGAGEILTRSQVQLNGDPGNAFEPTHELSFAVPRAAALDGAIQRGELVHVVAVFNTGVDAYTKVVARRVRVVAVSDAGDGRIAIDDALTVTIALDHEDEVMATSHALATAEIRLVRATRADPDEAPVDTYRPPAADQTDAAGSTAGSSSGSTAGSSGSGGSAGSGRAGSSTTTTGAAR